MNYSNDEIDKLIRERDELIEQYNRRIRNEIEKEKAKYIISWKRVAIVIGGPILAILAIELNYILFDESSVWSWKYWGL